MDKPCFSWTSHESHRQAMLFKDKSCFSRTSHVFQGQDMFFRLVRTSALKNVLRTSAASIGLKPAFGLVMDRNTTSQQNIDTYIHKGRWQKYAQQHKNMPSRTKICSTGEKYAQQDKNMLNKTKLCSTRQKYAQQDKNMLNKII